jgi:hypothetical protein
MLRLSLVAAGLCLLFTACPGTSSEGEGEGSAGEGEGEGSAGEGEGSAGEGEGEGGVPCGDVGRDQQCNGTSVEFCDPDTNSLVTYDCAAAPFGSATCDTVNAGWGVDCVEPAAGPCFFLNDADPPTSPIAACSGANPGCTITGADTSTCVNTASACSTATQGTCIGTSYVFGCEFLGNQDAVDGQPLLGDCAVLGGTCIPDDNQIRGGCYVGAGQPCTPFWTRCGAGPTDDTAVDCPAGGTCP